MIRALPGSVQDVATLVGSLHEIDTTDKTLIFDRGFVSEKNETALMGAQISFVLPLRRNSSQHGTRIHLTDHFFYQKWLIHARKRELDDMMLYLFKDVDLAVNEQKTLYRLPDDGEIDRPTLNRRLKRAGRLLILSSLTKTARNIYELYTSRNLIEDHFAITKSQVQAGKLYSEIRPQSLAMYSSGSHAPIFIAGS